MKEYDLGSKECPGHEIACPLDHRYFMLMSMQSIFSSHMPSSSSCSALLQVWVISRHYSDDTRMGLLLQRLACRLADRVAESIDIKARECPSTPSKQLQTDTTCLSLLLLGALVRASAGVAACKHVLRCAGAVPAAGGRSERAADDRQGCAGQLAHHLHAGACFCHTCERNEERVKAGANGNTAVWCCKKRNHCSISALLLGA